MKHTIPKIIPITLKIFVGLAAGYYIASFLYISISRIGFPLAFDWVESAVLVQSNRILLGLPIYPEPSVNYIPLVYQPLYFYVAALFIKFLGVGLMSVRLPSLVSSCGCILMIFLITKKVSGASFLGLIAAGMFAATYSISWTWFDLARVDMMCLFFFIGGLYFLMQDNYPGITLAGILCALSFFTKQTTSPIILLIFLYLFFAKRKQALVFALVFSSLVGIGTLFLNYKTNNFYTFYIYQLPSYHRLDLSVLNIAAFASDSLQPILIALGISAIAIVTNFKKIIVEQNHRFVLVAATATVLVSIWSALIDGSAQNAFIPAYAVIAIVLGLSLKLLQETIESRFSRNSSLKWLSSMTLLCIYLLQFSFLQYKVENYIPTQQDYTNSNALISYLKNSDGEFLMPEQNHLALYLDKKTYYHDAALGEFNGDFGKSLRQSKQIKSQIASIVHSKEISFIYLEKPHATWLGMPCKAEGVFISKSKFVPTFHKISCH